MEVRFKLFFISIVLLFGCNYEGSQENSNDINKKVQITGKHFSLIAPKTFRLTYEKSLEQEYYFSGSIKGSNIKIDFIFGDLFYNVDIDTINYIYNTDIKPYTRLLKVSRTKYPKEVEYHYRKLGPVENGLMQIEKSLLLTVSVKSEKEMKLVKDILESVKF